MVAEAVVDCETLIASIADEKADQLGFRYWAYSAWAGVGFFGGSPTRTALRAVVANVLGYLAYLVFMFVAGVVGVIVYMIYKQAGA